MVPPSSLQKHTFSSIVCGHPFNPLRVRPTPVLPLFSYNGKASEVLEVARRELSWLLVESINQTLSGPEFWLFDSKSQGSPSFHLTSYATFFKMYLRMIMQLFKFISWKTKNKTKTKIDLGRRGTFIFLNVANTIYFLGCRQHCRFFLSLNLILH